MKAIAFFVIFNLVCQPGTAQFNSSNPEQSISNTSNNDIGEHPWTAGLILRNGNEPKYCAGALITKKHVLTSAFCVDQSVEVEVYLGAHKLTDTNEGYVKLISREVFIHDGWDSETLQHDLAIVKLPKTVELNAKIQSVALPSWDDSNWNNFLINISGWGETSNSKYAETLQMTQVVGRLPSVCEKMYPKYFDSDYHYCFGGINTTMCAGDEGGPATFTHMGYAYPTLRGIASFRMAQACSTRGGTSYPGVFTNVYRYIDWINKYIAD